MQPARAFHPDSGSSGLPTDRAVLQAFLDRGITDLVTVPCSVTATWLDLAEEAAAAGRLSLVRTSHEGNLAGIAAGAWFGTGRPALVHMQNSGLPNAADGFISFALPEVYGIPMAVLVTWRGADDADDSEPHQAIGRRTADLCRAVFGRDCVHGARDGTGVIAEVGRTMDEVDAGRVGVMRLSPLGFRCTGAGSSVPAPCAPAPAPGDLRAAKGAGSLPAGLRGPGALTRDEAIVAIAAAHPDAAVLYSNGYTARAAQAVADRLGNFYNAGYMGGTLAMGWGLARARPGLEVVVVDGDQNAMMSGMLDNLLAEYPPNLHWYILDNGMGASVGGAASLPLAPFYQDVARVVATRPDAPGSFIHPRVRTCGAFEAEAASQAPGTLTGLARGFRRWVAQHHGAPHDAARLQR